jgi:hypothetical protein
MKVDKAKFEAVIGNLLKSPPIKRSEAKTGQPKTGKIIAGQTSYKVERLSASVVADQKAKLAD